jgi:hypothetical protein
MIVVRTEMQCKWGRVADVLEHMQAAYEQVSGHLSAIKQVRILTDMSGRHDTVVIEAEIESMDAYYAMMDAIFANPELQAAQAERNKNTPYESGTRNFYKVEAIYK